MAETEINARQLRNFALITSAMFLLLFAAIPWLWKGSYHIWPWVLALVLSAWGVVHPVSLRPLYNGWMRLAHVLGAINNRLILGLVFFVVLMPIGLLKRIFGTDSMKRAYDPATESYRVARSARTHDHLERPY